VNGGSVQTYAYSIVQTADGGYAAAGYGGILGAAGMFIVKFDNNGNTCGNTVSHNVSVGSGGILGSPVPTITNVSLTDTLVTPPTGSHGYVTPMCVIGIQPISNEIPASYKLYQNYPNPFNPATRIKFAIPRKSFITLKIFDITGREVLKVTETEMNAGSYSYDWNASGFASGIYFYRLTGEGFTDTKKMLLVK
jgi:hypothetical protein